MKKPSRPPKKPYAPPRLRSYGNLRTLTQGGTKAKNEAATIGPPPRTKP